MSRPSLIIRIDDRLIHGQVLVGWCSKFPIKKFIICDDEILRNEWERNLILSAASSDYSTEILSIKDTCQYINENLDSPISTMILVDSPKQIKRMNEIGLRLMRINVGGIHYREGRTQYLRFLFLSKEEVKIFKELMNDGYIFECQDLPTSKKLDLKKVLESRQ